MGMMFGEPYADIQERSFWLIDRTNGISRKDEGLMKQVAAEYTEKFGVAIRLVRCVPQYGIQRGQFVGFNLFE
jgi:hypothetical protein